MLRTLTFVAAALVLPFPATACPMCREALTLHDRAFARGWNASVLLLLALVPLALLGLTLAARRARREHGARVVIEGRPRWPTP